MVFYMKRLLKIIAIAVTVLVVQSDCSAVTPQTAVEMMTFDLAEKMVPGTEDYVKCNTIRALNRQIERYTTLKVQAAANPNVLTDGLYFLSNGPTWNTGSVWGQDDIQGVIDALTAARDDFKNHWGL